MKLPTLNTGSTAGSVRHSRNNWKVLGPWIEGELLPYLESLQEEIKELKKEKKELKRRLTNLEKK